MTAGRLVRFVIQFGDNHGLGSRDTLSIPLGTPTVLASDDASVDLSKWAVSPTSPPSWGIVQNDPTHPSRYFTDSPGGAYGPGSAATMTLIAPLNFSAGVHAYAVYDTRWDVERDQDAGLLEASTNGTTWNNVRSTLCTPGTGLASTPLQLAGKFYLRGTRWNWRTDWADLSAYTGAAGTAARLRFRLRSNGNNQYDGLSLDSIRVLFYDPAAQPALVAVGPAPNTSRAELATPWPNPTARLARFEFALPERAAASLDVLDLQGRVVRNLSSGVAAAGRYARQWDLVDHAGQRVSAGVYFVRLSTPSLRLTRRLVIIP